jgi:hypothetical protein
MSDHNRQKQEPYHTEDLYSPRIDHGAGVTTTTSNTSSSSSAGVVLLLVGASLLVPSSPLLVATSRSTTSFEFSSPLPPFQHGRSDDGDMAKNVHQHQQNRNAADPRQHDGNQYNICDNTDASPAVIQKTTCTFERVSLSPSHSSYSDTALYGRPHTPPYDCSQSSQQQSSNKHQTATTTYGSEDHRTLRIVPFSPIIISRKIPTVDSTGAVTSPTSFQASNADEDCNIIVQPNLFSNHQDKTRISSPSTTARSTSNIGINDFEHVLKRRKIGRQEYQFDNKKHPGDDDDDHSIETVFETVSTATPRSTQFLNISDIKNPLCDDLDAFPLFPESVFGQQDEKKSRLPISSTRQVPTIRSNIYSQEAWSDVIPLQVIKEMTSIRSQVVKEERSTPATTASTNDEYGFRNLLALSDRQLTTSFTIEVFDELEIVLFEESDRRNQRTHLLLGFAGLACRHCKVTADGRRGGRYFPSTMKTLTDSNKTLFAIHKHFVKCKSCPDDVKTNLNSLFTEHASEKKKFSAAKRRSGQRPFFDKVWGILRSMDDI